MMSFLKKKLWDRADICASLFLIIYLCFSIFFPLYSDIDNYLISLVTNGVYSSTENYVIYIHPCLCYIIKCMSFVFPNADNYLLLNELLMLIGVWLLSYISLNLSHSKLQKLCTQVVLFVLVMYKSSRCFDNFTVTAAFLMCVGMALIAYSIISNKVYYRWLYLIAIIFIMFGYMWRAEAVLMGMPYFIFMLVICYIIRCDKCADTCYKQLPAKFVIPFNMHVAKQIFLIGCCVFCCLLPFKLWNKEIQHSNAYYDGIVYNEARSSLVDYKQTWNSLDEAYVPGGVTYNDANAAMSMFLADTENMTGKRLLEIGAHAVRKTIPLLSLEYFHMLLLSATIFCPSFAAISFFVFLVIFSSNYKRWQKLAALCVYLSYLCYSTFFITIGRILPRVYSILYYYMFVVLVTILYVPMVLTTSTDILKFYFRKGFRIFAVCGIFITMSWRVADGIKNITGLQSSFCAKQDNESLAVDWQQGEDLYIWDVRVLDDTLMKDYMNVGKLYSKDFITHNIPAGEWIYGQPYFYDYLSWSGIGDPLTALLTREHTYYIGTDDSLKIALTYVQEHVSSEYRTVPIQHFEQNGKTYGVWQFVKDW